MANLAQYPQLVKDVFIYRTEDTDKAGIFAVRFIHNSVKWAVIVDDRLPMST